MLSKTILAKTMTRSSTRQLSTRTILEKKSFKHKLTSRQSHVQKVAPMMNVLSRRNYAEKVDMFCYQCEQTQDQTGCTTIGVCGKTPETSRLQDLLMYALIGVSQWAHRARALGVKDEEVDRFVPMACFATLTNVNFDENRFVEYLKEAEVMVEKARKMYFDACSSQGKDADTLTGAAWFKMDGDTVESLTAQAERDWSILQRKSELGEDVVGLQELITYGLKGSCAYSDHARKLGHESDEVYAGFHKIFDFLSTTDASVDKYLEVAMEAGQLNLKVMELLDNGAVSLWGNPEPTECLVSPTEGKCILVSGHDIHDLEAVLQQTEGKGINVYTHGELLPANAYPGIKKYPHLKGNYGGAWQNQVLEFSMFPGPILMTTNCITKPRKKYQNRIFTTHVVGYEGVTHISDMDFTPLIDAALECEGFKKTMKPKTLTIGFGRNTVLSVADKIVDGVKAGHIKHFFLIGGCDGSETERHYFKDMAVEVPQDCVILTLACGKYRFNSLDLGEIKELGIPRVLDIGQCNDSFGAIQIAVGLAKAFDTDVNSLPLSFIVSWFEQKAVAVLLTLLSLGIKDIHLGPQLPAFCTPNMLAILSEKFQLKQIGNATEDLKAIMKQ